MSRIKLGVVLESLAKPLRAALNEAAKLGVPGVQVDAVGDLAPDALGETGRREFRTVLRSCNLELAAIGCPLRFGLDIFGQQQARIDHVKKAMQFAVDLGVRHVVVPLPKIPPEPVVEDDATKPKPLFTFNAAPPKSVTLRESLSELGRFGDRIGVFVCLEAGLDSGEDLSRYLNTYDTGSLRVAFDTANHLMNGHDPLPAMLTLAKSIGLVHARDARPHSSSAGPVEVALGAGDLDWLSVMATLGAIEFVGHVCLERTAGAQRLADISAGISLLRRYLPPG